jgi:parvulin-like peptidyl-prolyl isomerase
MSKALLLFVAVLPIAVACCDGTLMGLAPEARPPETPLPAAPVETVARGDDGGARTAEDTPETIVAQHLLVMYKGAKKAPENIKRTRLEAQARAFEALELIRKGQDFDKVVAAYTDEPGGAAKKGDLGRFSRDMMVKPFSDAAFALEVGQVSTVIESPFGFHIIKRNQ